MPVPWQIVPWQYTGTGAPKPTLEDFLAPLNLPDRLGFSQDGEHELLGVRIGDSVKPVVLIVGGMHGNEWPSTRSTARMIEVIQLPENTWLLEHFSFYVVPVANPWGYVHNRRQNSRNVDLERNFDNQWETGDDNAEGTRWRGPSPNSEAETIILRDLILSLQPVAVLDVHGWGGYDYSSMAPVPHPELWGTRVQIAERCALAAGLDYGTEFMLYPSNLSSFPSTMYSWARYQTLSTLGAPPVTFLYEIGMQLDLAEQERQGVMTILQVLYDLASWFTAEPVEVEPELDRYRRAQYYEYT